MEYDAKTKYTPEFLRGMAPEDLEELLEQSKRKLFEMKEQACYVGRRKLADKPHLFRKIRRNIARIRTILREGSW